MASFNIHLAVGKRYLDKHKINNVNEFMRGIIEPDLTPNKNQSHYTKERYDNTLLTYLNTKVDLRAFLNKNKINDDYMKGVFLHLITDYLFFTDFFDKEYLNTITYEEFCKDLYFSYDLTDDYLEEKYNINLGNFSDKIHKNIKKLKKEKNVSENIKRQNILEFNKLEGFIEKVSSINLKDYKKKFIINR